MLRKLSMVGLLVVAGQGSLSQIFIGLCLSICSLAATIVAQPYKHRQNNALKLATEVAILLTLLVALVRKAAPVGRGSDELLSSATYDFLLVGVYVGVLPVIFIWAIKIGQDQVQLALARCTSADPTETEKRRRAVRLLQLGIASTAQVQLLSDYIGKLEYIVNKTTHIFISYRVAADAPLAKALYERLSSLILEATGQKIRVYLDVVRLEDGRRWDQGFMG